MYTANPPPVLGQTGFRIAAPYGLVFGEPSGTTHANIELPTSSAPVISSITASPASLTLPANSTQLSSVTSGSTNQPLRHWWAVKTTPAGARPQFDHQGATNTAVSNLVLPGAYTFILRALDDIQMTTQDKTVIVTPMPGAPVITSARVPCESPVGGKGQERNGWLQGLRYSR